MHNYKQILIILTAVLSCSICIGQEQKLSKFYNFTTTNGLVSNYVFCTVIDDDGNLWLGTDKGLNKYNGAEWQVFDVEKGLPGNYVNGMFVLPNNELLITIAENGFGIFNTNTNSYTPIVIQEKGNISLFKKDNNTSIIICTSPFSTTFYKYNYINKTVTTLKKLEPAKDCNLTFLNNNLDVVCQPTDSDTITIPIIKGLPATYVIAQKTLVNLKDCNFLVLNNLLYTITKTQFIKVCNIINLNNNLRTAFIENVNDKIYLTKYNDKLLCLNNTGNTLYTGVDINVQDNFINSLYKDKWNNLYLSTLGKGIYILPTTECNYVQADLENIIDIVANNNNYTIFSKDKITTIRNNTISSYTTNKDFFSQGTSGKDSYLGTFSGLEKYSFSNKKIYTTLLVPHTTGISGIQAFKDYYLMSTYGSGLAYYNKKSKATYNVINPYLNNIEQLFVHKQYLGCASYGSGFLIIDTIAKKETYFNTKNGLPSNYITHLNWIGDSVIACGKNGFSILYNNTLQTYTSKNGFADPLAYCSFKHNNQVYIVGNKLYKLVGNTVQSLSNNFSNAITGKITKVAYDSIAHKIIIGCKKGIFIYPLNNASTVAKKDTLSIYKINIDGKVLGVTSSINLPYNYDLLSIYIKNTCLHLLQKATIEYWLEGAQNKWEPLVDSNVIHFKKLRSGSYTLHLRELLDNNTYKTYNTVLSITVKPIIWLSLGMLLLYGLGIAGIAFAVARAYSKRKFERQLEKIKLEQQLENERQRISRDLHDNMGAYASALLQNARTLKSTSKTTTLANNIEQNAEQILRSLRETIWVLNKKEITIQDFSDEFKDYCFKVINNFENLELIADDYINNNISLNAHVAIELQKILQEGVQNIIKHSKATEIIFIVKSQSKVHITLGDNGIGIDITANIAGNGLKNMQYRAKQIGYSCQISGQMGKGTILQLIQNTP